MHELAVCQSLMGELDQIAAQHPGRRIAVVHIAIGPLSGVEQDLLADAFPIASAGSSAADATLRFQAMPIRVHCPQCGEDSDATSNRLSCPHCGNWRTTLISGDELILQRVEMVASAEPQPTPLRH
ncbi:MAG: hydrogenase maturation nickel metallochaperone HypA [Chromatiales bacterium]|nr:hydrogenase maturation nickel metallochaperone HypA [Gammaproteobacteria bacterium]MCP5353274.1 hydrogenase maturation nickel metallochaperone HypA [Chromatiales bacterium]